MRKHKKIPEAQEIYILIFAGLIFISLAVEGLKKIYEVVINFLK